MVKIPEDLQKITSEIVKALPVERVYLFGSFASGEQREDSDYDLYILYDDESIGRREAKNMAYDAAGDPLAHRPLDIIVSSSERFYDRATQPTLERKIKREGVIIYDAT